MGKPSSLSRKSSTDMSSAGVVTKKKRKNRKYYQQKGIKKLFEKMRQESLSSSVINLDDTTPNETVIIKDSSFIILDDEEKASTSPCTVTPRKNVYKLSHSTPKPTRSIDNLILNNSHAPIMHEEIINLTKEIKRDTNSTIDLTVEENQTVIDLANTTDNDCMFVTVSNASSMSGDSNVTVLNVKHNNTSNNIDKFSKGISNLNASEKGKLLDLITQTIFNGCKMPAEVKSSLANIRKTIQTSTATETVPEIVPETAEDTYIKQIILKQSRNSIGSNIYNPGKPTNRSGLRMIVIDGSNVAMQHGRGRVFSVKGLEICIEYFLRRGHVVKAFVPRFRCKFGKSTDPRLLDHMERQGTVVYTPSREVQGRMITPYDDRYIVQCAAEFDGIIVSGDNYRDLLNENPRWRFVIENRLLPFTFVEDMIMFPRDPFGRNGPSLEMFLKQ